MPKLTRLLVASGLWSMCAVALGASVDEALVARFEAASAPEEQQRIAVEIHGRLGDGQIAGGLEDRLIRVLASRPSLGHSRYTAILEAIGARREFSAASINVIAAGLVTDGITRDWPAYQTMRKILSAYQQARGLPEEAYSSLTRSLRSQRPHWMVIEVLATIAVGDPRHGDALSAIVDALGKHEHYGIRSAAIAGIDQMSKGRSLSERTLASLQQVALSDEYVSVRLEAVELLTKQGLDEERKRAIGESLAQELVAPTPGLWQRSPSRYSHADLHLLAIDLLTRLYDPPYPDHVIDALIMQTRSSAADRCIELLRANRPPGGFSDGHRKKLEAMAAQNRSDAQRAALFDLVAPQLDADSLQRTLDAFENEKGPTARIIAGYALVNHYAVGAVPGPVMNVAERILRESPDGNLQHVAATLIAHGDEEFAGRERRLLASLDSRRLHGSVYHAFVELYGKDRFEDLVVRYAADASVPASFRSQVILDLGKRATPEATLSGQVEGALQQAAWATSDYGVISAVHSALTAWRVKVPMIVHLKARATHTYALFGLLVLCALVNLVVCLVVFFRVLTARLREGAGAARRTSMALGWLALSIGMFVLLAFGLVGFLGHNSAPYPKDTLMFQIPAYLGTVVYLILAWIVFISTKNRQEFSGG